MEILQEVYLQRATPYMLRNDGKLLTCPVYKIGSSSFKKHPYLIGQSEIDDSKEFYRMVVDAFQNGTLLWIYKNINKNEVREKIREFVSYAIHNSSIKSLLDFVNPGDFDLTGNEKKLNKADFKHLFQLIENELNEAFLRVRTSDMFYGGDSKDFYCRVSSCRGFNWFPLIWQLVYDNKNSISSVTVTTDPDSGKTEDAEVYSHNGVELDHLDVDEFINLSGNPVIEEYSTYSSKKLAKGCSLVESFGFTRPDRINLYFKNRKNIELRSRKM